MATLARRLGAVCGLLFFSVSLARAAVFSVTNLGDHATGGTLRWAINAANTSPAPPHVIAFNLPSPFTMVITGFLPDVLSPGLLINGATQPGYTGTPNVSLSTTSTTFLTGLRVQTSNVTVRALRVTGFNAPGGVAIQIQGNSNRVIGCTIEGNQIGILLAGGTRASLIGTGAASNANRIAFNSTGIRCDAGSQLHQVLGNQIVQNTLDGLWWGGSNSWIGGAAPSLRNVISGNTSNGLFLIGSQNTVLGNLIGLNAAGTNAYPNRFGLQLGPGAHNNTIGGAGDGRNFISGNLGVGLLIDGGHNNEIEGNVIGLATNGLPQGNGGGLAPWAGVLMLSGTNNLLLNNTISANRSDGVRLEGGSVGNNSLLGNRIGVSLSGLTVVSNYEHGVSISNAVGTRIGASNVLFRNIIGGNGGHGIFITGTGTAGTVIQNNHIGCAINGLTPTPNGMNGVHVENAQDVTVGVTADGPGGRNLISGNGWFGISIQAPGSRNNRVQNNWIGADITGTSILNNALGGVRVQYAGTNNLIGVHGQNVISGNQGNGIIISFSTNVVVANNFIGVATNGTTALRNSQNGVFVDVSSRSIAITNNVISGNLADGIRVAGLTSSNIWIAGNRIGVNAGGTAALSNSLNGIYLFQPGSVDIGGLLPTNRNIISGNGQDGVWIEQASFAPISVLGNSIGVNADGSIAIPNQRHGVFVQNCVPSDVSQSIVIGGPLAAYGNFISGNRSNGIRVVTSRLLSIAHNRIGIDPAGGAFMSNHAAGVVLDLSSMTNDISFNHIANNGGPGIALLNQTRDTYIAGNTIGVGITPFSIRGNNGPGILIDNSARSKIGNGWSGGNRIGYNNGPGIAITSILFASFRSQHDIHGNKIYGNVGLPIDLLMDGVTTNDPAPDADFGWPNELQNFPVLNIVRRGPSIWVYSTLVSQPLQTYRIEYFASSPTDGMAYIGQTNVVLPASGTGVFAHSFVPLSAIATGAVVWATATITNFGTSEFSAGLSLLENLTDSDNDKMPNWWEILYGFNPSVSNAPGANADGDDYTDLDEWIAFTDPRDPQSFPRITAIAESTANRLVTFPSSDERVYRLTRTSDPATNPFWTAVSGLVTGQFGATTIPDTNAPNVHAYRMEVQLP